LERDQFADRQWVWLWGHVVVRHSAMVSDMS